MKFEDSYFEDEVREGFYVPSMVKRAWAAELEVLSEIDRICKKYDIPYFADWGSLLGAVRHGGFIPWDDDMDISMKRADYNRFMEVAAKELPEGFEVYNYKENEDYWNFVTRVVGKRRICFEEEHLRRFHGFPYIVGVDIFLLDYVNRDEEKENQRVTLCNYILAIADGMADGKIAGVAAEEGLKKIEEICGIQIDRSQSMNQLRTALYDQVVKLFSMFSEEESDYLTRMMPDGINGNRKLRLPKRYYDDMLWMPFENIEIPVPIAYDEMLTRRYGNYMRIVKDAGGHDYPFFEAQKQQLQSVLDFDIPHYSFAKDELKKNLAGKESSLKGIAREYQKNSQVILEQLQKSLTQMPYKQTDASEEVTGIEYVLDIIVQSQQYAIDFATAIENCKGEEDITVHLIEEYCEIIYQLHQMVSGQSATADLEKELVDCNARINESIKINILSRKEVVFMPYKAKYWNALDSVYQAAKEDPDTDVYVIVLPYYYKEYDGQFYNMQYEGNQFPSDINITNYDEFDFVLHQPDVVYIQNPYDQWNTAVSVPERFYSVELKKYTEKLVYIPYFKVEEFHQSNYREFHNMQYYCTVPGVINADQVLVQSESMKQIYIEKLVDFAGEDTRTIWEEKILGIGSPLDDESEEVMKEDDIPDEWKRIIYREDGTRKKVVLFHVEASSVDQNQDITIKKLASIFDVFRADRENMAVIWNTGITYEMCIKNAGTVHWKEIEKYTKLFKEQKLGVYENGSYEQLAVELCDIYYGDRGKLEQVCISKEKPVIRIDYEMI